MSNYDAIVIGSGLAGLTAGATYAKKGKKVLVLERHTAFGGAATIFKRKGLKVEVGLHEMDGLDVNDLKLDIFKHLGLDSKLDLIEPDNFYTLVSHYNKSPISMPIGMEKAKLLFIEKYPEQKASICKYFKMMEVIRNKITLISRRSESRLWRWANLNPFVFIIRFWSLIKYDKTTLGEYLDKLFGDNEALKIQLCANFGYYTDDIYKLSWNFFCLAQGSYHTGGYYIRGGSQVLSNYLVSIIIEHGGKAITRRQVDKLIMKGDRVVGVQHTKSKLIPNPKPIKNIDPQVHYSDLVIGNASPHAIKEMLPTRLQDLFMEPYQDLSLSTSLFTVYLGFSENPENFGVLDYSNFVFPEWIHSTKQFPIACGLFSDIPNGRIPPYVFVNYNNIDCGLTNSGKYLGVLCGTDSLSNWSGPETEYQKRKQAWLDAFITDLDRNFPGIAATVSYQEMATARTVKDYLNTPNGAAYGFAQTPDQTGQKRPSSKTSIRSLWLASAFSSPGGGFTGALLSGENAIKELQQDI